VKATIYLEGGGNSKELHARCREGFRRLLESAGFRNRMPRLVACGGRGAAFNDFANALRGRRAAYIAMWIDSEDQLSDPEQVWDHLKSRDGWERPVGSTGDQVLLMTTSMETYLVADRAALRAHFGSQLRESNLPPLVNLEERDRHDVQQRLIAATRDCSNSYAKGRRSFEILGKVTPQILEDLLPSFARVKRILNSHLS
jgi:hypothetical protein